MVREEPLSLRQGDVLVGRYRIDALIGEGGYGRVYRATQLPIGREVAIKLVNATDDELRARFTREAEIAQRLEHPNTVRLLDHGLAPGGHPFLAFELLRGTSVYELLGQQGTLSPRIALDVTAQILRSLAEAHALGIVHRDIKPENVFVTSHFGQPVFVKVLDFGIAKQRGASKLTAHGEALGTPSYMAPEQTLGREVDARTDLYAVGLLLAEMVTGRTVMDRGGAMTIMLAQSRSEPVPLGDDVLRSIVGPIVARAVRKDPDERYASAADMLEAVLATLDDVNATGVAPTRHGDAGSVLEQAGPPPTQASAAAPSEAGPVPAALATLASHSPTASSPHARSEVPPPVSGPHVAPPTLPGPSAAAPQKPSAKLPRWALAAIAVIAMLSLAVAVLVVREVERADPDEPRRFAVVDAPPPRLHPLVRFARTSQVAELRRLLTQGGYPPTYENGQNGAHTFMLQRMPCVGSVILIPLSDEAEAERVASQVADRSGGAALLVAGRAYLTVSMMNANGPQGPDAGCTNTVVRLLAR